MAAFKMKIEGLSECVDALKELPKATGTNVQKRALQKAGEPMAQVAQSLAPKRTGTLQEDIEVGTKLSPRTRTKKESKVEVYIGPKSMPRAIVAEFGSVKQSPTPFMRPAWDAEKVNAAESIRDVLWKEIKKAADRLARKTARLQAKSR